MKENRKIRTRLWTCSRIFTILSNETECRSRSAYVARRRESQLNGLYKNASVDARRMKAT